MKTIVPQLSAKRILYKLCRYCFTGANSTVLRFVQSFQQATLNGQRLQNMKTIVRSWKVRNVFWTNCVATASTVANSTHSVSCNHFSKPR